MFVQKLLLDFEDKVTELFIRRKENEISFDTFFNSFNTYLIKHYTNGTKLVINLDYEGAAKIKIKYKTKDEELTIFRSDNIENKIEINLDGLEEESIIYPVFSGDLSDLRIKCIDYQVETEQNVINPVAIITTFNRQEFLIPNLRKLKSISHILPHVIAVDNGRNLVVDENEFPKSFLTIIPNDNLGGTGGFARGMIEAKNRGFSHMFIMDDDITLIPEVVEKSLSLISSLKQEHRDDWLGFSMLPLSKPTTQFELGTNWNGIKMMINKHNFDVSKVDNLFKNQVNNKYNYSAWWSLIMPVSVLEKYGYPYPFFIKFDDIEYGLRRKKEEIILTNGFAVWHEDFDKKYNPYLEYYLMRNSFVTNALWVKHPRSKAALRFLWKNVKAYFLLRHIEMNLMNIGVDDFLAGPEFFLGLDIEENNKKIRNLASKKVYIFKGIFVNPFITIFYLFKILFRFNETKKVYLNYYDKLTNIEYWNKIFSYGK